MCGGAGHLAQDCKQKRYVYNQMCYHLLVLSPLMKDDPMINDILIPLNYSSPPLTERAAVLLALLI